MKPFFLDARESIIVSDGVFDVAITFKNYYALKSRSEISNNFERDVRDVMRAHICILPPRKYY